MTYQIESSWVLASTLLQKLYVKYSIRLYEYKDVSCALYYSISIRLDDVSTGYFCDAFCIIRKTDVTIHFLLH